MGLREKFDERIRKKEQEIQDYESKLREARASIEAWIEAKKLLPREDEAPAEKTLRPDSLVGKTCAVLQNANKPLHVSEILRRMGEENTPEKRVSLSGSIAAYVRRNEIFTRPAPNTFGLKIMETARISDGKEESNIAESADGDHVVVVKKMQAGKPLF
jgi:hypothetical protein